MTTIENASNGKGWKHGNLSTPIKLKSRVAILEENVTQLSAQDDEVGDGRWRLRQIEGVKPR